MESYYIYLVNPLRKGFKNKPTLREEKIVRLHFNYLKKLLNKNILFMAGPALDKAFGVVIFKARSLKEAEGIMKNDPAVKRKIFKAEVHRFRISLLNHTNR